ncbi:MAG: c-type cytochrome [Chitinophagales bacterium]|jgi:cytochrome c oxidase cbb3-type subunit 3|nr:c-type cytochrome [Chitinophagales bacterium]
MNNKLLFYSSAAIFAMIAAFPLFAQSAAADAAVAAPSVATDNTGTYLLLTFVAIVLLIVIYILGNVLVQAATIQSRPDNNSSKLDYFRVLLPFVLLFALPMSGYAQDAAAAAPTPSFWATPSKMDWILGAFGITILIESLAVFYLASRAMRFIKPTANTTVAQKSALAKWWNKINNFVPIEQEVNIDSGHNYDGIRELNNITPPWFTFSFAMSIIFAVTYLWRYHVAQSAPLQIQEYNIAVEQARIAQAEYLKKQSNNVDENNVKMLGANDIAAGEKLFVASCAACHGAKGNSQPGGVGPNLTDNHWIHGGSIQNVFKTVKYGYPDKGMKSWKDDFTPNQIAQLTSYIESIKGTNVAGGKEPQGELEAATDSSAADSTATTAKTDTTSQK